MDRAGATEPEVLSHKCPNPRIAHVSNVLERPLLSLSSIINSILHTELDWQTYKGTRAILWAPRATCTDKNRKIKEG